MNTPAPTKHYTNGTQPDTTQAPQRAIEKLLHDLQQARGENAMLRNRLSSSSRPSSIIYRAIADAHLIILAAATDGQSTGRQFMRSQYGMSQRRHGWACAFLRLAGIAEKSEDWRAGIVFKEQDTTRAIALLEETARRLTARPSHDALRLLRACL